MSLWTIETATSRKTLRATRLIIRCPRCKRVGQRQLMRLTTTRKAYELPSGRAEPSHTSDPSYFDGSGKRASTSLSCCGLELYGRDVQGSHSEKHRCGAKCLASKGPSCECQCGGANHGAGHAAV